MLRLRLRSLFRRSAVERELDAEMEFHIAKQVEENRAAGMSEEEASEAARRQFGGRTQRAEECRDARRLSWVGEILQDVRYAVRGMRRDRMLTLVAALSLAICIGANTTIFSIVNTILLRPLPYPAPARLYWIAEILGRGEEVGTGADYYSLRAENRVFEDVAAFDSTTLNWSGAEKSEEIASAMVSPSFFRVLGERPMLGRTLARDEEGSKAPPVVVASYRFWRNRLGSDMHITGKPIRLQGLEYTVIGVMPQGYDYPRGTDLWQPLPLDESSQLPRSERTPFRILRMVARLKAGVGAAQLDSEMARLTRSIRSEYPPAFETTGFLSRMKIFATPLQRRTTGDVRPALLILSGAVGLVLLIACANLANLLLARAASRQRELAVRLALGSARSRIVRQVLTESVAFALPGGALGALAAYVAVAGLNAWQPSLLQNYPAISLDSDTLAFTLGITVLTGLTFGLAPAGAAAGVSIQEALKGSGHTASGGRRTVRLRQVLIAAELGLSLMLLIAAGLLGRSFLKLAHTELGFRPENLLTFNVNLDTNRYPDGASQLRFFREARERIQQLPGVRTAAVATDIPLSGDGPWSGQDVQVEGHAPIPLGHRPLVDKSVVSPEFFRAMDIPLRKGRLFDPSDGLKKEHVILVNESFAHRILPGEDPVGRAIRTDQPGGGVFLQRIVGVVGDTRGSNLGTPPQPLVYGCDCQAESPFLSRMVVVIRTSGDPHSAIRAAEHAIGLLDRDQPVFNVRTMEERLSLSLAPERFHLILIGTFAAIAVVLAALGVYGVMCYLVAQRTREIGIRIALGARSWDVAGLVMKESALLAVAGLLAGLSGSWALTRYLRSLLHGVATGDTATFATMPVLLLVIAAGAALVPALRAARIDPVAAFRED